MNNTEQSWGTLTPAEPTDFNNLQRFREHAVQRGTIQGFAYKRQDGKIVICEDDGTETGKETVYDTAGAVIKAGWVGL